MRCPNCKQTLADNINTKVNFCPFCGKRLYDTSKHYLMHIYSMGAVDMALGNMLVFIDERLMYEVKAGEGLLIVLEAGFHTIKFRVGVRNKSIQILLDADFEIKAHFNTATSLIETLVNEMEGTEDGHNAESISKEEISQPVMISETGEKGFETVLGDDMPEYEFKASSGLLEGELKLYSERLEFTPAGGMKKETLDYKNIVAVNRKMGTIDVQCAGNVHKVYSIPKDIYNEVIVFLTKKIEEVKN